MKKFVSVVLALTMVVSMFATASATPISGYLTPTSGPYLSYTLPVNIMAQRSGTTPDDYAASPLTIVDSIPTGGIGVDFKTTLDMTQLRTFFSVSLPTIYANLDSEAKAEFDSGVVSTDVTVKIEYAGATVANPNTDGGLLNESNVIFDQVSRTFGTNSVEIKYNNNKVGTLTAADLVTNAATYLKDLVFELKDSAVYSAYGTYEVKVTFSGQTAINFTSIVGDKDVVIDYPQSVATYTVTINAPSTGGGGSSYNSIKFETNGGNELKNISVRRGGKAELPVPVREGYVFTGWYTDSALTTPFDKDTVINKNYTLYAAWIEDNGAAGSGHETPDMLNGEDHFAYVVGYPDGTVRPNANITRAEVTSIFFRLLKDEVRDGNLTNDNIFNDVNGEDWYNTAVSTMAKLGIVNGRTADEFVPNANITRAEFAAICARFDASEYSVIDSFTDIENHWAEPEIHETAAYGWIKGYEDGTFKPDKAITRAEAMTMINRVLNRVPETADDLLSDMIAWPDNSDVSAWYYIPVQEATNSHDYDMKNNIYEKWTAITDVTDWTKYE